VNSHRNLLPARTFDLPAYDRRRRAVPTGRARFDEYDVLVPESEAVYFDSFRGCGAREPAHALRCQKKR
jgi:hypothetical protein